MIAGIEQPNQRGASGQASVVDGRHHYPSPFSQVLFNLKNLKIISKKVPVEERPHSCTFCYKRFARADECKRHERIHTDTRPFSKCLIFLKELKLKFHQRLSILPEAIHAKGSLEDAHAMSYEGEAIHLSIVSTRFCAIWRAHSSCENACEEGRGDIGQFFDWI